MLYKEYDPEVLKNLQKAETVILRDFDTLCQKYGVDYFACGGTALGGLRHGGFIPWDDDIDVGMTREHYDRFLQIAENEFDGKYKIINPNIDAKFPVPITKWYHSGTVFRNEETINLGINAGIAIDIFCFDNIPDDDKKLKRQATKAWIFGKLMILRRIGNPSVYAEGFKERIILIVSKIANFMLKLFCVSPKFLFKQAESAVLKYKDVDTKRVAYLFDPTPYTSVVSRDDIYPTVRKQFENIELNFPCRVEKYLERRYGPNYMQLPPEDKRHNHAPEELDFGNESEYFGIK